MGSHAARIKGSSTPCFPPRVDDGKQDCPLINTNPDYLSKAMASILTP